MNAPLNMADLTAFLKKAEDYAGRDKALHDAFMEVSTALADILQMLEKQGPETAKAIAKALQDIKFTCELKAPTVNIDVKPTPVQVNVQPAKVEVQLMPAAPDKGGWKFDFETAPSGAIKSMTAKRI